MFVAPAYMTWQRSGEFIAMVVLGGMGTLIGPIIGGIGVTLVEEWLAQITQHWKVIFGPMVILVAIFARGGIVKLLTRGPVMTTPVLSPLRLRAFKSYGAPLKVTDGVSLETSGPASSTPSSARTAPARRR